MTVGKLQATDAGKMLCLSSGKLMGECCCEGCQISITPDLQIRYVPGQSYVDSREVTLTNDGDGAITWAAEASGDAEVADNTTIDPSSGSLDPGVSVVSDVEIDGSGLGAGVYSGSVVATGLPGPCTASATIDLLVATLYSGNVKFHAEIPGTGNPVIDRTVTNLGPGTWAGSFFPVGTWLYFTITAAGAVTKYDANAQSPVFPVTYRYSDGYPVGNSEWWLGAWGNTRLIKIWFGPDVW